MIKKTALIMALCQTISFCAAQLPAAAEENTQVGFYDDFEGTYDMN